MDEAIPSEDVWRGAYRKLFGWKFFHDPDVAYAYKHFAGKSREEAVELFIENSLYFQEDVMFMPEACFRYYVHSYMDYLMSDKSEADPDGASCFFGLVEIRQEDIKRAGEPLRSRVLKVLDRLAAKQAWYDADLDIYGDFRQRAAECPELLDGS